MRIVGRIEIRAVKCGLGRASGRGLLHNEEDISNASGGVRCRRCDAENSAAITSSQPALHLFIGHRIVDVVEHQMVLTKKIQ